MDTKVDDPASPSKNSTRVERRAEHELVVSRLFDAPVDVVFDAWTKPELLKRWWAPKSFGLSFVSCATDVRIGGSYRFVFNHPDFAQPMEFFGRYIDVIPSSRLVWTNDEAEDGGQTTTVTFEDIGGATLVVMHERYASKEALDAAISSGSTSGFSETFDQLDELLNIVAA